ncbi:Lcl domain-containing protein [Leptospira sp. GIMC2001]|uniref:Lcl domain-containing protein n=1 Tax=Leptospira sp. GIMC2001 TaxID=1513297 RepID=UPI0023498F9A|nr:DUF1566 domain-containing protein [Leptospira sp. GIMC2001]WCL47786.1 DUF1566 domain-containing protein [Leptospira sp. GIMC2001]
MDILKIREYTILQFRNLFIIKILIVSIFFTNCQNTIGKEDLDPDNPLGLLLQLYPFIVTIPNTKEIKFLFIPETKSYGIINGTKINITVPFQTGLTNLKTNLFHDGRSIQYEGIDFNPELTSLDFTTKIYLNVIARDESNKNYEIQVSEGLADSKELLNFQFDELDVRGIISTNTVFLNVPFGTDLSNLAPTFSHSGAKVYAVSGGIQGEEQIPRETRKNFNNSQAYRIVASDGSTQDYTISVNLSSEDSNNIEQVLINGNKGTTIGDIIYFIFPSNQDISSIPIIISHKGKLARINGNPHKNGESLYNLNINLILEIEAFNGSVRRYSIRSGISVAPGTFSPSFTNNQNGTISDNNTGLIWMRCILSNVPGVPRTGTWCVDTAIGNYSYCNSNTNDCNGGTSTGSYGDFVGGSNSSSNTAWRACNLANTTPDGGYGGRTNWRLPRLNELQSIIDYAGELNASGFAGKPYRTFFPMGSGGGQYNFFQWTASTFSVGNTLSYKVWGTTGAVETESKTTVNAVRCVSSP